jgi:hypothetical protein
MRPTKITAVAFLASLMIWSESTAADFINADAEGWHTWQFDASGPVAEMCCFTWHRASRSQKGCNLDGARVSYGSDGDCSAETGNVQVYAFIKSGRPTKIRVLSSECPVSTETQLTDHGVVSTEDNIEWFREVIEDQKTNQDIREEALFGLVQSRSDAAFEYIDRLLSQR